MAAVIGKLRQVVEHNDQAIYNQVQTVTRVEHSKGLAGVTLCGRSRKWGCGGGAGRGFKPKRGAAMF